MSVPNTSTFGLDTVRSELGLSYPSSLNACFTAAVDTNFDPLYKGSKDRLSNFRNYSRTTVAYFTVYTPASNTIEYASSISLDDCRTATYGNIVGVDPYSLEVSHLSSSSWVVRRLFLAFDLSSLSGKTIVSAYLRIGQRARIGAYTIQVLTGTQSNSISGADYNNYNATYILSGVQSEGVQSVCDSIPNYITIQAASSNLPTIQSYFGSIIKMALLHPFDYSGGSLSVGEDYYYRFFRVGEIGTNCYGVPNLVVEYY